VSLSISIGEAMGTIIADPLFVTYTRLSSATYHVQSGSRAVEAGTALDAAADDFDGGKPPRISELS
jgi:hypothetical protein